ncbi:MULTISPECIES: preprotein translocase subunit SecY [Flavobacterium]|jgi:preprotein translocase subunit SecY|uniref:Protein translocase subunit SecY n=3 Tax=Flavobacterium TaxID=237 RepID=A0A4R5F4B7_9FLAO|nr:MULTISPECIES: preprotein translocase subunit SecY [Flavobacterium]MDI5895655.1 preprotein translocase subunit SecY [Flavobacterium algoritolerans]MDI6047704.1 preprotein translocase subunit SecY [Flavobacterium yafengii]MDI6049269.1 preprotein translocase subunit SecY [Flavobacterium sp. XS2P24]MDP3679545.1 preprotein translocase subunit SecY [Flavobacterium sp.]PIF60704.1 protein translocase subunit secY/sec61 alpha [Flavobacterium sp. 11]
MKKFIESISNVWKIEELKNRILITLGLLLVYRFGAQVTLPGIDATQLGNLAGQTKEGIGSILDMFTGGAFSQASVFALGIMPYISASIVVQLMGIAIPYLQKLQSDGESGRKKINQITRWLTIGITLVQGPTYIYNLYRTLPSNAFLLGFNSFEFLFSSVVILVTGTIFAMWLGEKITDKGIGNGISLLIMVGILARLPQAFIQEFTTRVTNNNGGPMLLVIEIIIWLLVIICCVLLVMAIRKIPVQYARRTTSGDFEQDMLGGNRQWIPLKLNASGVMPIIFAQAIMFIPAALAGLSKSDASQSIVGAFSNMFGFWYNFVFATLIIVFTFFYTAITVPTNKMSDDLKRSGGFIPGIRPGVETSDYLDKVMSLITFPGSLFLALIAVFPAIVVSLMDVQQSWAMFFGGTSLIIMVGVAIDTMQQINSYLLNKHYDGLMKSGKNRKAVA